ncbi:MAG: CAP domain-containing protein, partial [Myxococcota bacterium]|nr:CAP domain-containing protein [Myxococcota bacterium]
ADTDTDTDTDADTDTDTDADTDTYTGGGYGDVDEDGYPSWGERDTHFWTNAVRVAPQEFQADYERGGCEYRDFESSEKSPKDPLYYDRNLNIASRAHSQDMYSNHWFDHDSSDGTDWDDRISSYYTESSYFGENIAYGYGGGYRTVLEGWMCSAGHRSNIMLTDYNEMGTGDVNDYQTQDFAQGNLDSDGPLAMGIHYPEEPGSQVTFYADWLDSDAPDSLDVVVEGDGVGMSLLWGEDTRGVFSVSQSASGGDCTEYYFEWSTEDGDEGRFPEQGSYTYGSGCTDDLMWVPRQL